jgi:hypothetical protein
MTPLLILMLSNNTIAALCGNILTVNQPTQAEEMDTPRLLASAVSSPSLASTAASHPPPEDCDVGGGPALPNLGPLTGAIHNISARHLHDINTSLPDERQFLRSWRRQLQDCLAQQNSRLVRFLMAEQPTTGEATGLSETEISRKYNEILTKYSKPTWNFASSTRDLSLSLDTDTATAEITRELGVTPAALRDILRRVIRMYVNTANSVCSAEQHLEEKLKRLETIVGRVNDLMFLEPTSALGELTDATRMYLDSIFDKISIEEDYTELMAQYKKFAILKSLISLNQFQRPTGPTCTICMTKEISQVVTPCGHTFCEDCCRTQMTSCYICRVQIRDKVRIYF